jgi:RNA polymerase sigma-70 factor (ECF subfamily)
VPLQKPDTEELLRRAVQGDGGAMDGLLNRCRPRLRRMVAVRMDSRLAARVDPSDVVQETLVEAIRKLPDYVAERRLPFYPWLRELAWEHLVRLHRHHVRAQRRSVTREEPADLRLSDASAVALAGQVAASGSRPSGRIIRREMQERVRTALEQLVPKDREILIMRHLEQLEMSEIAAILKISRRAAMMRRLRAFEGLRRLLSPDRPEPKP